MNNSNYYEKYKEINTDLKPYSYQESHNILFNENIDNNSTDIILVDSSMRNWDNENSSSYTVTFNEKLQHVVSLELVDGFIPRIDYNITESNNMIYYQESSDDIYNDEYNSVELPVGLYNVCQLVKLLGYKMTKHSKVDNKYCATYNSITRKISISSNYGHSHIFNLIFTTEKEYVNDRSVAQIPYRDFAGKIQYKTTEVGDQRSKYIANSIGKLLGFYPINLRGEKSYTGQGVYALNPFNYVALHITTDNSDDLKKIIAPGADTGANGSFAIIDLNNNFNNAIGQARKQSNVRYIRTFNPPINFNKLKIEYKTPNNTTYNMYGLNNYILLEVKRAFTRENINTLSKMK